MFHSRSNEKKKTTKLQISRKGVLTFKVHLLQIKPALQENYKEKNLHTILHVWNTVSKIEAI